MTVYRILACDLVSGDIKDEIPFTTHTRTKSLCRPGSFTATLPSRHPKATPGNLWPSNTTIYVEADGQIDWGGILWTTQVAYDGSGPPILEVGGEGLWSYFRRRELNVQLAFTQQDQLTIARTLVAAAFYSWTVDVQVATCGVLRDRRYHSWERKKIGEAVEQLAAVVNGFDFDISSAIAGNEITNTLRWYYPRQGTQVPVAFDLGSTVSRLTLSVDGTVHANFVDVLGVGEAAATRVATSYDITGVNVPGGWPILEETFTFKDISDPLTLTAIANAKVLQHRRPRLRVANLQPAAVTGGYGVGDLARVRVDDGWGQIDEVLRIVEVRVEVDENGKETPSVTFAEADTF